jgi:hypothetical protein
MGTWGELLIDTPARVRVMVEFFLIFNKLFEMIMKKY